MTAIQRASPHVSALMRFIIFREPQSGRERRRLADFGRRVKEFGQLWTVDEVLVDADRRAGVLEWTQFDKMGRVLTAPPQSSPISAARNFKISTTQDAATP
jgi:hypothetical protein